MKPVNTKSMMSLLCLTMEKLSEKQIEPNEAIAMSKLLAQAENLLNYELKRTVVLSNPEYAEHFRNIEEKAFDSVPQGISTLSITDKIETEMNKLALELKELKETVLV